jgi:hypothetical protein
MIREILGLALISVGFISIIAHIIATGRRAARHTYDAVPARTSSPRESRPRTQAHGRKNP